jgi:hypothetical protein
VSPRASRPAASSTVAACLFVCLAGLSICVPSASGAAPAGVPLSSAIETGGGSWAVLPMGDLSSPLNTFWQVLHADPGSSQWSVVTPQGVADNGGLVAGGSALSMLIGTLPSQFLTFSPLSASADGGTSWSPVFLPGALTARPDALADAGGASTGSLAIVGTTVLRARKRLTSWSPLVSLRRLDRATRCGATALDAVAVTPSGAPLVATGCGRGGVVAVFTPSAGSWTQVGTTLSRRSGASSTGVVRLESGGAVTTALVAARRGAADTLVALWQKAGGWTASAALALPSNGSLLASSVGAGGTVAVMVGPKSAPVAYDLEPGGAWTRLPPLPPATSALGPLEAAVGLGGASLDAFTVAGTALGVYALTPSGATWAKVQSTQVPLAYGSSG